MKYFFCAVLLFVNTAYSSDFKLNFVFTEGESSKDSWSSTMTVTIERSNFNYKITYSGYTKDKNESKSGVLTEDQVDKIVEVIVNGKLNFTDSITDYTEKLNSNYNKYASLSLSISLQGVSNTLKIEGDKKSLKAIPVYNSALDLVDALKDVADSF